MLEVGCVYLWVDIIVRNGGIAYLRFDVCTRGCKKGCSRALSTPLYADIYDTTLVPSDLMH